MTDGISALEGFDYQAMVALELMLEHFDRSGSGARARPEGVEDVDLVHSDEAGVERRLLVQIKKPRQDASGRRQPTPWLLRDVVAQLLAPRWSDLQDETTRLRWVLGDALAVGAAALLGQGDAAEIAAARRAAAELLVRERRAAPLPDGVGRAPGWESPFRGDARPTGTPRDALEVWAESFARRAERVCFDGPGVAAWKAVIEQVHNDLDRTLQRVTAEAPHTGPGPLREQLVHVLGERFGLEERDVRDVVFRNLRGFVDDIARARETWIDSPMLEAEIVKVWPRRVATVLPPPLPAPHLPRPAWVSELAGRTGAVVGPSGAGKTTSATELYGHLRREEPDSLVLYAEVRQDTAWRSVLEGVVHAVGRRGDSAPYELLPSIRAGDDEALLRMADALEASATPVSLLVDLVDGGASPPLVRDLSRFVQRLPAEPTTRLWVFGQEDALAGLSDAERRARGVLQVPAAGFDWESFFALARLHGLQDRPAVHEVFSALTSGATGVPPRVADAVLRLPSIEDALAAAQSDDVLLAADTARYRQLHPEARAALGALACLAHPVRLEDAESTFPAEPVRAGVRAGLRAGLLYPLGDGRTTFHDTVRRTVLAQLPRSTVTAHHARLADLAAARGDHVLEAHHAEAAGQTERARTAGRAAFFDPEHASRVGARAIARRWVTASEAFGLVRLDPDGPYAWWQALHHELDDATARALLDWWSESVGEQKAQQVLWQAPKALVAARPDLLEELAEIAATRHPPGGRHYGASALGVALRGRAFDEAVLLKRFERAAPAERAALAETLSSSGAPRCLGRWLRYANETQTPLGSLSRVEVTDAHVVAILDELPDAEPAEFLVHGDWGFGFATPFLWSNRDAVGRGAMRLLEDDALPPRRARVALRLLGLTGHEGLLDASRRWGRRRRLVQSVALAAPLLVDARAWREELAEMARDPSVDRSTRVAAFAMYTQSGDGGSVLLGDVARITPDLEAVCRWTAALTFTVQPSVFTLDLLLEHLKNDESEAARRVVGTALGSATHFADGPDAPAVARRLVPLLEVESPLFRRSVLHVLSMLRQPDAREACAMLAVAEGGTPVGAAAAVAACASRPTRLDEVRGALEANPGQAWLLTALVARFQDAGAQAQVLRAVRDPGGRWAARRRALQSLERLPATPEVDAAMEFVLEERSLLGALDTLSGQLSGSIAAWIEHDPEWFLRLWAGGEEGFVDLLGSAVGEQEVLPPRATPEQIESCLRAVWRRIQAGISAGSEPGALLDSVMDEIQVSQVQSAALRVAGRFEKADVLERVLATCDSPWLVLHAAMERIGIEPRSPEDARRWAGLVAAGPCGRDAALAGSIRQVLRAILEPRPVSERAVSQATPDPPRLDAAALHRLLDARRKPPERARIADLDDAALASLVTRLDPADDSDHVEVAGGNGDAARVALTAHGATVRPPAVRSTGRKGDRPGLRALLAARFPDRVPAAWLEGGRRGHAFVPKLVRALADTEDPVAALSVLRRLPGGEAEILGCSGLSRLGAIADDALVEWIGRQAGSGGPSEVAALAAFARQATADAVVRLLRRLMRRVEGQVAGREGALSREPRDPWRRALIELLQASRLSDVAGASGWLVRILTSTEDAFAHERIIAAMASFPSTWWFVEARALKGFEYGSRWQPAFRKSEEIAHALFWAGGDEDVRSEAGAPAAVRGPTV